MLPAFVNELLRGMLGDKPEWAYALTVGLGIVLMVLSVAQNSDKKEEKGKGKEPIPAGFRSFQFSYLSVYMVIMLSDWMQGTHMWTLYNEYRESNALPSDGISTLFTTGNDRFFWRANSLTN